MVDPFSIPHADVLDSLQLLGIKSHVRNTLLNGFLFS